MQNEHRKNAIGARKRLAYGKLVLKTLSEMDLKMCKQSNKRRKRYKQGHLQVISTAGAIAR